MMALYTVPVQRWYENTRECMYKEEVLLLGKARLIFHHPAMPSQALPHYKVKVCF